jgi:hypothetical protein
VREEIARRNTRQKERMSRESMVQVLGAIVFAATVLVTVVALVHLFS